MNDEELDKKAQLHAASQAIIEALRPLSPVCRLRVLAIVAIEADLNDVARVALDRIDAME